MISPADDVLIRVERPLMLDSEGQLVASILSKKAAIGSQRVLVDIPVGPTVKVRSAEAAEALSHSLVSVGASPHGRAERPAALRRSHRLALAEGGG
jgi:thymidine phosphorylase